MQAHEKGGPAPAEANACLEPRFELEPGQPGVLWFNPWAAVSLPAEHIQAPKAS
jgi:hypothetical protein